MAPTVGFWRVDVLDPAGSDVHHAVLLQPGQPPRPGGRALGSAPPAPQQARSRARDTNISATLQHGGPQRRLRLGVMGGTFDPDPSRPPCRGQRGRRQVRPRRGRLRPDRPAVAEVEQEGQRGRAPLPDDRHRHGLEPAVHREPGGRGPAGPDLHHRHPAGPADPAPRRRPVLHHRRGRPGPDPVLERHRRALVPGPLRGVTRPGHVLDGMGRKDVSLLEVPAMAISSTDCRDAGAAQATRSGTWCRTAWSSTSPNTDFTPAPRTQQGSSAAYRDRRSRQH